MLFGEITRSIGLTCSSRQFNEILRTGSIKKDTINSITAFNYMQAGSNLERIADHASSIAEISMQFKFTFPREILEELSYLGSVLGVLIDESISTLLKADSDKADKLIDNTREIRKRVQKRADASGEKNIDETPFRFVLASGIERMLDYIMNIGELTINLFNANRGMEIQNNTPERIASKP
jgi:phosphate uptake regulator